MDEHGVTWVRLDFFAQAVYESVDGSGRDQAMPRMTVASVSGLSAASSPEHPAGSEQLRQQRLIASPLCAWLYSPSFLTRIVLRLLTARTRRGPATAPPGGLLP